MLKLRPHQEQEYKKIRREYNVLRRNETGLKQTLEGQKHFLNDIKRISNHKESLIHGFDLHHIIPLSQGGTNDFDNLIGIPKAIHTLLNKKEATFNTRDKVLDLCEEYRKNENDMNVEEFQNGISQQQFDRTEYMKTYNKKYRVENSDVGKLKKQQYYKTKYKRSVNRINYEKKYKQRKHVKEGHANYSRNYRKVNIEKVEIYNQSFTNFFTKTKSSHKSRIKNSKTFKAKLTNLYRYQYLDSTQNSDERFCIIDKREKKIIGTKI